MNADRKANPNSLDVSAMEQIDRICDQYEAAWKSGDRPRIEDYLSSAPDQLRSALLRGLVDLELDYRRRQGETPTQQEFETRFADDAETVRQAFAKHGHSLDRSQASTQDRVAASLSETQDAVPDVEARTSVPDGTPKSIGRYKIVKVLGQGAFGMVYRAHDGELDRDVAIKVWRADRFATDEAAENLLREARAVARLDKHPSIVGVHDVGRQEDGSCYIVFEFVEGRSLDEELESRRLPEDRVWEIMAQVTSAIQHAHAAGLVHRDLKPANILLDTDGNAHVADFGLAVDETSQRLKAGEVSGTPAYMAPEQVRGEAHRLDGRADIWAAGAILYEMLTEQRPFHGDTREELFDEILHRDPKPPRQIDPEIDEGLQEICLKCLAKPVTERYPTAADLANHLRNAHPEQQKRGIRPFAIAGVAAAAVLVVIATWQIVVRVTHQDIVIRTPEGDTLRIGPDGDVDVTIAERPPISRMALVSNPASIPGVSSWTIETKGHRGEVLTVAHSPDGNLLATGCEDGTIRVWNPATGKFVKALVGHDGAVQAVSWSSDSQHLASGSADNTVRTWDVPSGQQEEEIPVENPDNRPVFVEFSPDGSMLAFGGGDGQIHLWDITERKPMPPLDGPPEGVRSVAWSSDSKMLAAAGGDNNVTLWNVTDATVVQMFRGHTAPVTDTAFSPDDKYVASSSSAPGGEQQARVWETASGKPHCVLPGHLKGAQCVAFSTDGRLLVTGGADGDGRVRVWNIETSESVYELESKDGGNRIAGVAVSPDGKLLAIAHHDGTVQLCELESGDPLRELPKASGDSIPISPDGRLPDSQQIRDQVIYVVETDGTQTTIAPSQFGEQYGYQIAREHQVEDEAEVAARPQSLESPRVQTTVEVDPLIFQWPVEWTAFFDVYGSPSASGTMTTLGRGFSSVYQSIPSGQLESKEAAPGSFPAVTRAAGGKDYEKGVHHLVHKILVPIAPENRVEFTAKAFVHSTGNVRAEHSDGRKPGNAILGFFNRTTEVMEIWIEFHGGTADGSEPGIWYVGQFSHPYEGGDIAENRAACRKGTRIVEGQEEFVPKLKIWRDVRIVKPAAGEAVPVERSGDAQVQADVFDGKTAVLFVDGKALAEIPWNPGQQSLTLYTSGYTGAAAIGDVNVIVTRPSKVADETQTEQAVPNAPANATGEDNAPPLAIAPFDEKLAKKHQQAWADYLGVPVEMENSIGMKFVLIPPGEFDMGSTEEEVATLLEEAKTDNAGSPYIERLPSEAPKHRVRITKPYWLSRHEVTRGQFRQFVDDCGYKTEAERDGKGGVGYVSGQRVQAPRFVWNADLGVEQADEYPVMHVSWNDATAFCEWLSEKEGVTCRLPSEAQWEYACRAGTTTYWHCGDDETTLQEYAWFDVNSGESAHPVEHLRPNAWGLYDTHGNVWSWCSDWYGQDYYGASPENDPTGAADGTTRVYRGGSYRVSAGDCRSAFRNNHPPGERNGNLGFRVAREISNLAQQLKLRDARVDREVAEYVLGRGGGIYVYSLAEDPDDIPFGDLYAGLPGDGWLTTDDHLPQEPFRLIGVRILDKPCDADLQRVGACQELRNLLVQQDAGTSAVTDAGLVHLANLVKLKALNLQNADITAEGLESIGQCRNLLHLNLYGTNIAGSDLNVLRNFPNMAVLSLRKTGEIDSCMDAVNSCNKLLKLQLMDTAISDDGLRKLESMPLLADLLLTDSMITDDGLDTIARMTSLERLGLSGTRVTDAGIAKLRPLSKLTDLYLGNTQVTDDCLDTIAKMSNLAHLSLSLTKVSDVGLVKIRSLSELDTVRLGDTQVTADGISSLQEALPDCEIVWEVNSESTP